MKRINILLFVLVSIFGYNSYANVNAASIVSLQGQDINFTVFLQNDGEIIADANVNLRCNGKVVSIKTNDLGFAKFFVSNYNKEKATISVIAVGFSPSVMEIDELKDMEMYDFDLKTAKKLDFTFPKVNLIHRVSIRKGDSCFTAQNYVKAIEYYQTAMIEKPMYTWSKSQIKRIGKYFLKSDSLGDLAFKNIKRHFYRKGDSYFVDKKYEESKEFYMNVLIIDFEDEYAKSQIEKLNKIILIKDLNSKTAEEGYIEFIELADSHYVKEEFKKAIENYRKALILKANEKYPTSQIKKIRLLQKRVK